MFKNQIICVCGCHNCEIKVVDKTKKFNNRKKEGSSGCQVHKNANLYCKDCNTPNQQPQNSQALLARNSSDGGSIKNFQDTYNNFGPTNTASIKNMKRTNSGYDLRKIANNDFKDDDVDGESDKVYYCEYCEKECGDNKEVEYDPYQVYQIKSKNP